MRENENQLRTGTLFVPIKIGEITRQIIFTVTR